MDLFAIRYGLVLALVATLLLAGCRSPAPSSPAPTPIITVATPAAPAEAPPEPEKPPWDRLLVLQAVFTGGAPEPPCPAEQAARVLVTGDDGPGRMELAQQAGCVARTTESEAEVPLCCPGVLEAPSANRTAGGKSCEEAQQEYLKSPEDSAPDPLVERQILLRSWGAAGSYLSDCALPNDWALATCTALRDGTVIGLDVRTTPASIDTSDCIAAAIKRTTFPSAPRTDIIRIAFAPSEVGMTVINGDVVGQRLPRPE